jgi:hypothetical protein
LGGNTLPGLFPVPPTDSRIPATARIKPRLAKIAQDGHSHAEQAVYSALWDSGSADNRGNRVITIGLGKLSRLARLSENNCRLNIRSLVRKLALEELEEENSRASIGKTYLVYNYSAILQRRKAAGMEWVVRTKGVAFVRADGSPFESAPPTESVPPPVPIPLFDSVPGIEGGPGPGLESVGGPPTDSVPPSIGLIRKELQEEKSSSSSSKSSLLAETAREFDVILDDDIVERMRKACRLNDPAATDEEIAYMLTAKLEQLRKSKSVTNMPPLLVKAVANLFPSNELQRLRAQRARELQQSREATAEKLERARRILADGAAEPFEREWAEGVVGALPQK